MKFNLNARAEMILFVLAAALNAGAWVWAARGVPPSAFPVIVSYNVFWGQDFLGERPMIFSAPLLGALILALNAVLFRTCRGSHYAFLRAALAAGTAVLQAFILVVVWIVIRANT